MPDKMTRMTPIAIALLILAGAYNSSATVPAYEHAVVAGEQSKVAVRPEDLPEAVKSTLAGSYSDWKVSSSYLITRDDNSQYYEVNIKRGEESSTVNLDKYGKKID